MAKLTISNKHIAISKANTQMVIVVAAASFITVFCLMAAHSLWAEEGYQSRVIAASQKTADVLKRNVSTVNSLMTSYKDFVDQPQNIIGGSSTGNGSNDGDNAKIVLDALPSEYDFPGLTSSLESIFTSRNLSANITGTDDEVAQNNNSGGATPQPVTIPFGFTLENANYTSVQDVVNALQRSIRPLSIDTMTISGSANSMQLTVSGHTYYQPPKTLSITSKVVQ